MLKISNIKDRFNEIFSLINEYTDLRYFWMTNKDFWRGIEKKNLFHISLNRSKSMEYVESKNSGITYYRVYLIPVNKYPWTCLGEE